MSKQTKIGSEGSFDENLLQNFLVDILEKEITKDNHFESVNFEKIKSPFGYFGAKNRIAQQIARELPPHNAWVDAFCGSLAVTLGKPPAPIEIINDKDSQVVNLFRQLRDHPEELCRLVSLTPYSREEFSMARIPAENLSELEQARRFLISSMMAINGAFGMSKGGFSYSQSYARRGQEARVSRWNSLPIRLLMVVKRLKKMRIEHRDARDLIKMFLNRPATLLYLDPPYLGTRSNGYAHEANDEEFHAELLKICKKARCMVLVSGYENDLYSEMLTQESGWTKTVLTTKTRNHTGKDSIREEILWMNKAFRKAKETGRVTIRLTKKERKENKINPIRKR